MNYPAASDLLLGDLRSTLQRVNPKGYNHQVAMSLDLSDLLIAFMNWRIRLIAPLPRTVHMSSAMKAPPVKAEHEEALKRICRMLESGVDVAPYLSKNANSISLSRPGEAPKRRSKRRKQLDAMLSDWGVYHLHLGVTIDSRESQYVARTGDVLFMLIGPSDAYLIGIFEHEDWANEEVARIIIDEWLEHSNFNELRSGVKPVESVPPTEWLEMRQSGVSLILDVDGRFFCTGNMTLAATSMGITETVNGMSQQVKTIDGLAASWATATANEPTYRVEERRGWYGLAGPTGFHYPMAFPWWYDGQRWTPPAQQGPC